jgi:hypothetical protein
MRFGAAVAIAVFSAVIATLPAAVRVASAVSGVTAGVGDVTGGTVWLALVALAVAPLALTTVAVRHAVAAVRLFDAKAVATGVMTAVVWGASSFVALGALGAVLRATTHHHGLAGVTFASVGALVVVLLAPFAARAVAWTRDAPGVPRWMTIAASGLAFGLVLAVSARVLGRDAGAGALAVDLLAFGFASAFGGGAFPARSRPFAPLAYAGPPLATIVLVVGLASVRGSVPLASAVAERAPLYGALVPAAWGPASPANGPAAEVPVRPH